MKVLALKKKIVLQHTFASNDFVSKLQIVTVYFYTLDTNCRKKTKLLFKTLKPFFKSRKV